MPGPHRLLRQARERRELTDRLRQQARGLSLNADKARMLRQAEELEAEARHLEQQATASDPAMPPTGRPGPPVQQEQLQQQQQHDAESEPSDPRDSGATATPPARKGIGHRDPLFPTQPPAGRDADPSCGRESRRLWCGRAAVSCHKCRREDCTGGRSRRRGAPRRDGQRYRLKAVTNPTRASAFKVQTQSLTELLCHLQRI